MEKPIAMIEAAVRRYLKQAGSVEAVFLSVEGQDPSDELLACFTTQVPPVLKASAHRDGMKSARINIHEVIPEGPKKYKVRGQVISPLGSWGSWVWIHDRDSAWVQHGEFGHGHPSKEGLIKRFGEARYREMFGDSSS